MNQQIINNKYMCELIKDVRNNNEKSLIEIINIFKPHMISLSKSMNNTDFYDDLLGELLELIMNLDLNKENIKAYIKACLRNYYLKCKKDYGNNLCLNDMRENIYSTEKDCIENELLETKVESFKLEREKIINNLASQLKGTDKEIFIEYYLNNKSIKELENSLGKSKSTIYNKLNKAKFIIEKYVRDEVSI